MGGAGRKDGKGKMGIETGTEDMRGEREDGKSKGGASGQGKQLLCPEHGW
jgi:hypothetical protein